MLLFDWLANFLDALLLVVVAVAAYVLLGMGETKVDGVTYLRGLPLIGCLLDFLPEKLLDSLHLYRDQHGKFFMMKLLNKDVLVLSDAKLCREVLSRRPKQFRKPRNLIEYSGSVLKLDLGLFHANGAAWSRMRRVTAPSFSSQNISSKLHAVLEELEAWMVRLHSQKELDMSQESFSLTIRVISRLAFGLAPDHPISAYFFSATFLDDVKKMFDFSIRFTLLRLPVWLWRLSPLHRLETEAVAAQARLVTACQQVMEHKRELLAAKAVPVAAMIDSLLLKQEGGDGLTDEEIVQNVKIFYLAGSDTTAITISWMCYYLSLHPDMQEKVRAEAYEHIFVHACVDGLPHDLFTSTKVKEMVFINAVVKETLRLKNPASLLPFELEDDQEAYQLLNGHMVRKGQLAWVYVDGVLWDEDIFPDALSFRPERWLTPSAAMDEAFISFGQGPRTCPGMLLATVEASLAIAFLAHHFRIELACPAEEITRVMNVTSMPNKMPLRLTPHPPKEEQQPMCSPCGDI